MLLNENEKLFAKVIPVSLKDVFGNQARTSQLFLTMEWQDAKSSAGLYNRKELMLSLTDNDDPFFLYSLKLSEEDFQKLKSSQDLLIDFASFPQHIIKYIEECLLEERNPQPKYLLVFTVNDKLGNVGAASQLDIIEAREIKNLVHLSLRFVAAADCAVRQYLSSCFRQLKEENRLLQSCLANTEQDLKNKLANSQQALNCKVQELESLRKEFHAELTMKNSEHAKKLDEERDRLISRHKEEENRLLSELNETKQRLREENEQLESKYSCLNAKHKALQGKNSKYESTIKELKSIVHSLEKEIQKLKDDVKHSNEKCDHLQSEVDDKESQIQNKDKINYKLRQDLQSKEDSIINLKKEVASEMDLKNLAETDLRAVTFRLERSEETQKALEKDKHKMDRIILELQQKLKEMNEEDKAKQKQIQKYKRIAEEKESALLEMKREINEQKICLETKNAEVNSLANTISNLQKKLYDIETDIRTKENVIKWLNKQLNQNSVIPQYTVPSNLVTSPVNTAFPSTLVPSPSNIAQNKLVQISSSSPESTYPVIAAKNATAKSVRIETASPLNRKNTTVSGLHRTDSAYFTASPTYSNHATPEIVHGSHNINKNQKDFEFDQDALSAAFQDENHVLKHSTAKKPSKPTKPVKSTTPRIPKKR